MLALIAKTAWELVVKSSFDAVEISLMGMSFIEACAMTDVLEIVDDVDTSVVLTKLACDVDMGSACDVSVALACEVVLLDMTKNVVVVGLT